MLQFIKRTSSSVTSAASGKVKVFIDETGALKYKDDTGTLTSAITAIKTINGTSLIGDGNIVITGGSGGTSIGSTDELTEGTTNLYYNNSRVATYAQSGSTVATQTLAGFMSATDKLKLNGIADNANNYTHPVNHPASIITQDANNRFVTDAEKTAWNAKQAALGYTAENVAAKGIANGYAPLDSSGLIPSVHLPSYVDDVVEFANLASLPATGTSGIIYITLNDNKSLRWSGSSYVEISASPGSTDAVVEGTTNLYFTVARVRDTILTGLSVATNAAISASDSVLSAIGKIQSQFTDHFGSGGAAHSLATTSVNGFLSATDKTKLDGVAAGANNYTHPANHPPSIITQDANNRFSTDAEKTTWNAKQAALVSGTNIKTINGTSVLGSGDIVVGGGSAVLVADKGTVTGAQTFAASTSAYHIAQQGAGGIAFTLNGWPTTGTLGELTIELINGGANANTWSTTIRWLKSDGTYTTDFSASGKTLLASGTNFLNFWTRDGGATIWGVVL